jgi:hypothetical protein
MTVPEAARASRGCLERKGRDPPDARTALAEKHGIPMQEVTLAMGAVDEDLSDLVYDHERALLLEVEDEDHA